MNDPFVLLEQRAQERLDEAAFGRLPATQKRLVLILAAMGFTGRQGIVGVTGTIIGFVELLANYLLVWPYVKLWESALWVANGIARAIKLSVSIATGLALGSLTLARAGLNDAAYLVRYFAAHNVIYTETGLRWVRKITNTRDRLFIWAEHVAAWGARVKDNIDAAWAQAKQHARSYFQYAGEAFELYIAIALFRATKWILDPRLKLGAPLLGNERLNKIFGFAVAVSAFVAFAGLLTVAGVWAKFLHAHLAASFVTDTGPVILKIAKQALYHPLISVGLTCAKFVFLPIIAATRQAIKSTDFTRGVAHAYSMRLRQQREHDAMHASALRATPSPAVETESTVKPRALVQTFNRFSLGFIGEFVVHVIEKSSPNYYEGRLHHYRTRNKSCARAYIG